VAPFVVTHDSPLSVAEAWARITDWPRHGDHVPFTRVEVTTATPPGVGTVFNARTRLGRLGFDDPMEVVEWRPPVDGSPGFCRIEKRGRVMLGWAELTVEARTVGSRTTWREEARPARLPAFADGLSRRSGRFVFGRVARRLLEA
jgi:hypothetical protein